MKHLILKGFAFILLAILFFGILGFAVMQLWNWLIPSIFHAETIDFWQAIGLLALCRILFAGFGGAFWNHHKTCSQCNGSGWEHKKQHWKQKIQAKMSNMSNEEKEQFKAQMREACQAHREEV